MWNTVLAEARIQTLVEISLSRFLAITDRVNRIAIESFVCIAVV